VGDRPWVILPVSGRLISAKSLRMMVARDGVEQPTPAFSGLASPKANQFDQKHLSLIFPPKLSN
jgi:hypothetical protein